MICATLAYWTSAPRPPCPPPLPFRQSSLHRGATWFRQPGGCSRLPTRAPWTGRLPGAALLRSSLPAPNRCAGPRYLNSRAGPTRSAAERRAGECGGNGHGSSTTRSSTCSPLGASSVGWSTPCSPHSQPSGSRSSGWSQFELEDAADRAVKASRSARPGSLGAGPFGQPAAGTGARGARAAGPPRPNRPPPMAAERC
jgi:hypothetical protein